MVGPLTPKAGRIHHYTTPRQFCQEKSCTKVKKIFSRNLVILSIAIYGQSVIIDNVKRETPEPQVGVGLRLEVAIDRSPITLRSLRSGTHGIKEKIHEFFLENLLTIFSTYVIIGSVKRWLNDGSLPSGLSQKISKKFEISLDKSQRVCYNRKCQEGVAQEIRGRVTLRKYRK